MSRLHTPGTLQGIWLAVFLMLPMQLRAEGEFEAVAGWWKDLWRTPDQQAQRLFDAGDYAAAASLFTDPMRIGMSWFRAG